MCCCIGSCCCLMVNSLVVTRSSLLQKLFAKFHVQSSLTSGAESMRGENHSSRRELRSIRVIGHHAIHYIHNTNNYLINFFPWSSADWMLIRPSVWSVCEVPGLFFLYGGEGVCTGCGFLIDLSLGDSDDGGAIDMCDQVVEECSVFLGVGRSLRFLHWEPECFVWGRGLWWWWFVVVVFY
jgi:hypothetical protein